MAQDWQLFLLLTAFGCFHGQQRQLLFNRSVMSTLCDPTQSSTPGFPALHYLLEFSQTHVHWVDDAIHLSHSLSLPFSSCPQPFPASGSFPVNWFFASGGQSIGASASVLPVNIQGLIYLKIDWFDLLAVQGILRSLLQHHSWKASILRCSELRLNEGIKSGALIS